MYYETAYPSLLSGVSQQVPQDRLPGQVSVQDNMSSDLVRGLCRRAPAEWLRLMLTVTGTESFVDAFAWQEVTLSGQEVLIAIRKDNGTVYAFNKETGAPYSIAGAGVPVAAYLTASSVGAYRATSLASDGYIVNTEQVPGVSFTGNSAVPSEKGGYFYVPAGTYNNKYELQLRYVNAPTDTTLTATFTTPDGSDPSHPDDTTPQAIAAELQTSLNAAITGAGLGSVITTYRRGAYVFVSMTGAGLLEVNNQTSTLYLRTSGRALIRDLSELPAMLPVEADGYTVQIGTGAAATYYRYAFYQTRWVETCAFGDNKTITNLCVKLTRSGTGVSLQLLDSDPRNAGDSDNNPDPAIIDGITGIASWQGRLVYLAGDYVVMSATNNPKSVYRTSLAAVLDTDPIEIADSRELSKPYRDAVSFNGDLLVVAENYQSLIPGGATTTPRTALISIISNYDVDTNVRPLSLGRTTLLPTLKGGAVGLLEALPPESLAVNMSATDITAHIPSYIAGDARFITGSTIADTVVVGTTTPNALYVHQFLWNEGEKVHSAWHRWTFRFNVVYAYFIQDVLYVVYEYPASGLSEYMNLALAAIRVTRGYQPKHFLDFSFTGTCDPAGVVQLPTNYAHSSAGDFRAFKLTGDGALLGEDLDALTPAAGAEGDVYVCGFQYESVFSPTAPVVKDRSDFVISSSHTPLRLFKASVVDTGVVSARVSDRVYDSNWFDVTTAGIYQPYTLGTGPLAGAGVLTIPARTAIRDTVLLLKTDDYYDMNIKSLEYGFKLQLKHRRA